MNERAKGFAQWTEHALLWMVVVALSASGGMGCAVSTYDDDAKDPSGKCKGFDYKAQCKHGSFECNTNSIPHDSTCSGFYDECIACPPGTRVTGEDGDGCDDTCTPCPDIKCPSNDTKHPLMPFDSDGDSCPDTCPSTVAISGQCPGIKYTAQCDPAILDCGPKSIPQDSSCQGHYESCLDCPKGTHAVDHDLDGCQEVCDACPVVLCPSKDPSHPLQPVDSDGDGCADTCPNDNSITGHCAGVNYEGQCGKDGLACGPSSIHVDKDCDGSYDSCTECPDGQKPVDRDNDGCAESCERASPVFPPPPRDPKQLEVVTVDEDDVPTWVKGPLGFIESTDDPSPVAWNKPIQKALTGVADLLHLKPELLTVTSVFTDAHGDKHVRVAQSFKDLPVLSGGLAVHIHENSIYAINGRARDDLRVTVDSYVKSEQAAQIAISAQPPGSKVGVFKNPSEAFLDVDDVLQLIWSVHIVGTGVDGLPIDEFVLISMLDGTILERRSNIWTARAREIYATGNTTTLPGVLKRAEFDPSSSDPIVNTNFDLLGKTYECFHALYQRDSYDHAGATLKSTVHYRTSYNNASWNGSQFAFGDGDGTQYSNFANAMDITAHEFTHALTDRTSHLNSSKESGGLNEAMSDIMGSVCEWFADNQVVSADTWRIGEDISIPSTGGNALRHMDDPQADGESIDYYPSLPWLSTKDIHYRAGVANLAFYLLAHGGTHPRGKTTVFVPGIGIHKAAQIFYYANTALLTSTATFHDALIATTQAVGQLGYPDADAYAVMLAWKAVGVAFKAECDSCTRSAQCGSGALCKLGKCASGNSAGLGASCCRDYQCSTGSCNASDVCQCTSDSQCPSGQYCAQGFLGIGKNKCVPFKAECDSCTLSAQCGPGALCKLGKCASGNSVGMGGSCCRDYQCTTGSCNSDNVCQCTSDSQCSSGQYCAQGFLGIGKNTCVSYKDECDWCVLSSHCAPGALCKLGKCATGNSLSSGQSCCRDYQCTNGNCKIRTSKCN